MSKLRPVGRSVGKAFLRPSMDFATFGGGNGMLRGEMSRVGRERVVVEMKVLASSAQNTCMYPQLSLVERRQRCQLEKMANLLHLRGSFPKLSK